MKLTKLYEISIDQIKRNNVVGFPETKKRQHIVNLTNAKEIKFDAYVPSNTLIVGSVTTSNGHNYKTSIRFNKVDFTDNGIVTFRGTDNEDHSINPLNENSMDVDINCDCMDFRFRFAEFHYQNKSLVGDPPPPYVKKTDRPPINPTKALGGCKHVLALAVKLRQMRIIR